MIAGIGVDMTSISRMRDILADMEESAQAFMFTPAELARSREVNDAAEYLATRFAAKEAVTKALAPLVPKGVFNYDMRIVETLNREDGSPCVQIGPELREVLDATGVAALHVSITTECDTACAFVVATT